MKAKHFTSDGLGRVASFALPILLVASVGSAAALPEPNPGSQSKPDFSKVRKSIQERVSRIPSISVAVARKREILWEEGFGWADRTNRIPATEHTMYYTASVTKSFTATALMILHERKKVDLDRPVNDYLKGAKLSSPAFRGDIPLTFSIRESGEAQVQLGSQPVTVLTKTKFNEKRLAGLTSGKLAIEEDTQHVEFCLYLRDGALKGAAVTLSYSSLPYWAELKRESHEHR